MHTPVLLKEVLEYLSPGLDNVIMDATLNGGGHAEEILKAIGGKGTLIGIEQDEEILKKLESKIKSCESRIWEKAILINENFRNLDKILESLKIKRIDGAIFDLGMSSLQLENSGRGFSFQKNEPLIMTFKSKLGIGDLTARDIINQWREKNIADILYKYGEERYSRRIARNIAAARKNKKIETTLELVDIIRQSVPASYRNSRSLNCATKTFQALRIVVNDELNTLNEGIQKAWDVLKGGGRMVVISFHSLEDRIVKNFFKEKSALGQGAILTKKPITPDKAEKISNPRSRSAKLRAAEKII